MQITTPRGPAGYLAVVRHVEGGKVTEVTSLLDDWYSHGDDLLALVKDFKGHDIVAPDTPHDREVAKVVAFKFAQAVRTFRAVIAMARLGDGTNAMVLMRTLFENLVDVAYLVHNSTDVWRYLEEAADLESKIRKAAQKYGDPEYNFARKRPSPEQLLQEFSDRASKESSCKSWRRLSTRDRAEKSGYPDILALYELVYPTASAYVHGSSGILLDYLRGTRGGGEFRVDYERTDRELEPAVGLSSLVFLRFIAFLDALFSFGLRSRVEELHRKQLALDERSWKRMVNRYGSVHNQGAGAA